MTVMWRYFEKDAYHPAWVKFSLSHDRLVRHSRIPSSSIIKDSLKQYRGTLAGWEICLSQKKIWHSF